MTTPPEARREYIHVNGMHFNAEPRVAAYFLRLEQRVRLADRIVHLWHAWHESHPEGE